MSEPHLLASSEDGVLTLRLNRPDKKNALTQAMYGALADQFDRAAAASSVRVVLLAAQPDCFCSGNDIGDFLKPRAGVAAAPTADFMRALSGFAKPVVAAPAGLAIGIGVTMLLHCDLVYCGEQTRLQLPFVSLGICPEFASTALLPRLVGYARAAELVMLGQPFSAQEALAMGLVTGVAANAQVEALALAKARQLAALPPGALRATKRLLKRGLEQPVAEAMAAEAAQFTQLLNAPEAREAFTAFLEKRKPDFSRFS